MTDCIIWDMDGTILNTLDDLADSVNHILKQHGMKLRTKDEIRSFVGNGIPKLIERAVPTGTDENLIKECLDDMMAYYKIHSADKTAPYDGIVALMKEFESRNIRMAVVTNKEENAAKLLCGKMFADVPLVTVGAKEGCRLKPYPDGVFDAMNILGVKKGEKTVYIGDSEVDVMTAHNSGLKCIGVLWGFRNREILEENGCDYIVSSINELENLILGI